MSATDIPYPVRAGFRCGFSIVEAVIGIFILTIGYLSISNLFFETGFHYMAKARDYSIALNICERFLNMTKARISLAQPPKIGDTDLLPEIKGSETLRQSLDCLENGTNLSVKQTVTAYPGSDRLFLVSIRMSWSDKPTERISLSTLVGLPEYSRK